MSKKIIKRFLRDFFINFIASSFIVGRQLRYLIYKIYGIKTQSKGINPGCVFTSNNVTIGKKTFVNYRCIFDNKVNIEIGDNCSIAHEVIFAGVTHKFGSNKRRADKAYGLPIKVENGCWIGARVIILPGVTIGEGCIIAAGAVVNKDCAPNGLYAGVPARRIKDLL